MDIIGIDLDSVIGNTEFMLDNYFKDKYGVQVNWELVNDYKIEKIPDLPKEVYEETLEDMFNGSLLFDVLPYNYSEHALNKLFNEGFKIAIITSRPLNLQLGTMEWLDHHNLKHDFLFHVPSQEKYKIISAMGIKSFIEDRVDIVDSVVSNCSCIEYGIYVVAHPWNKDYKNLNVIRVNGIAEAVDRIVEYRKWRNFLIYKCQGDIKKFIKEYYDGKGTM